MRDPRRLMQPLLRTLRLQGPAKGSASTSQRVTVPLRLGMTTEKLLRHDHAILVVHLQHTTAMRSITTLVVLGLGRWTIVKAQASHRRRKREAYLDTQISMGGNRMVVRL